MAITRPKAPSLFDYTDAIGGLQLTFAVPGTADSEIELFDDQNNNGKKDARELSYKGLFQNGQWLFQTDALTLGKHHFRSQEQGLKASKKVSFNYKGPQPAAQLPTVGFETVSQTLKEDQLEVTLKVSLSIVNKDTQPIRVKYSTEDDTATAGEDGDYQAATGILEFAKNQKEQIITLTLKADQRFEDSEQFRVILSEPSRAALEIAKDIATVTLQNAQDPTLAIDPPTGGDMLNLEQASQGLTVSGTSTGAVDAKLQVSLSSPGLAGAPSIDKIIEKVGADGRWSVELTPTELATLLTPEVSELVVTASIDGFGASQIFEAEPVDVAVDIVVPTIAIDSALMTDDIVDVVEQTNVTISGATQGAEVGQTVNVTLTDQTGHSLSAKAQVEQQGLWQVSNLDFTGFSRVFRRRAGQAFFSLGNRCSIH